MANRAKTAEVAALSKGGFNGGGLGLIQIKPKRLWAVGFEACGSAVLKLENVRLTTKTDLFCVLDNSGYN